MRVRVWVGVRVGVGDGVRDGVRVRVTRHLVLLMCAATERVRLLALVGIEDDDFHCVIVNVGLPD